MGKVLDFWARLWYSTENKGENNKMGTEDKKQAGTETVVINGQTFTYRKSKLCKTGCQACRDKLNAMNISHPDIILCPDSLVVENENERG